MDHKHLVCLCHKGGRVSECASAEQSSVLSLPVQESVRRKKNEDKHGAGWHWTATILPTK